MTFFRSTALTSAVFAIGLTLCAPESAMFSLGPNKALADVDVSVNVGTFYDRLSPHGDWVRRGGAYVFIPVVSPGWRPYTLGHWEYTNRYGWIWVSDEPFGWATYHYGRWGFEDNVGWYWVPANQWAPAWVSWRRSNGYVAWAPLPPERDSGISIDFDIDSDRYADRYWAIVPAQHFLAVDIGRVVIRDRDDRFRRVFRETRPLGRVKVENRIVVNNIINVTEVERATKRKVRAKEIREVNNLNRRERTNAEEGNTIDVFAPPRDAAANAKPKNVKAVEEVVRNRKNRTAEEGGQANDGQVIKRKPDQQKALQGDDENTGQPAGTKQRRKVQQTEDSDSPAAVTKKKRQVQQGQDDSGGKILKPRAKQNEKALKQLRDNQSGQPRDNQNRKKRNRGCEPGTVNCPG